MKRYIIIIMCMLCATNIIAQKYMVIHKSDGTKIKCPIHAIDSLSSWGKHTVNDNDYIKITEISGLINKNSIKIELSEEITESEKFGVVWGTDENLTIENGNSAAEIGNYEYRMRSGSTTQLNTPYYFRAYVTVYGITYYSEVKEHIFRPQLKDYTQDFTPADIEQYKEGGYAVPTDTAFAQAYIKQTGFGCTEASLYTMKSMWQEFITPERIKSTDKSGAERIICHECDLYMIDTVPEEFMQYIFGGDDSKTFIGLDGCDIISANMSYIECPESYGVYNNHYWLFTGLLSTSNPIFTIDMPRALPGYTYNVNIIFAPETNDSIEAMPHKLGLRMQTGNANGGFASQKITAADGSSDFITDNATKCDTISFEWETDELTMSKIEIKSNVARRDTVYARNLRVVGIFVERKKK